MNEEMEQQEQTNPSIWKSTLSYGLLTGFGLVLVTVIFYLAGSLGNRWINFVGYLILVGGIIVGIKSFRDDQNAGVISYGRALGAGTLVGLFAAIISSAFSVLLFHVIDPAAMQQMLVEAELNMIEQMPQMTDAQLEDALQISRTMMKPFFMFFFGVLSYTFIAFLFSLIIAAFLKRNPTEEF
ncbi:MAG: DUF4199 domain-containing protein [Bacteroidales bacterium]